MKAEEYLQSKGIDISTVVCYHYTGEAVDGINIDIETILEEYAQSQLKERDNENRQVKRLLKNALEYYHNHKFAYRAKSMKSLIEDALDILKTK